MGRAASKSVPDNTGLLIRFSWREHISLHDPFWHLLLDWNIAPPKSNDDEFILDDCMCVFFRSLYLHNPSSGHIGSLIQIFIAKAAANTLDREAFNALFIVRSTLKNVFVMEKKEEDIIDHVEFCCPFLLEIFIGSLVDILVNNVTLKDFNYAVHLEAVRCLLVFLSVKLITSKRDDDSNIYRLIMNGRHAIHAPLLVNSLLQNFMKQQKAPSIYGGYSPHQSGFSGITSNLKKNYKGFTSGLWSMMTFNWKPTDSIQGMSNNNDLYDAPLATQSLHLILVLINNRTTRINPYRESLFTCTNSDDNNHVDAIKTATMFEIDYGALETLCKQANKDAVIVLLCLLLHRNIAFRAYLLNRIDLDQLIVPILKTLYHIRNSNSHHIYISRILLILSEDDSFNTNIHKTKLKEEITWYAEKSISEMSLGSLLVLVVIRAVQYSMVKMHDKHLLSNCLAALANMSAQFTDIDPYISQRLLSLFETLAKHYHKLHQKLRSQKEDKSNEDAAPITEDAADTELDLGVLEEALKMVLKIFNSCLTNQLINNPNLVHSLLCTKHIFESLRNNPAFQDIVQNIETVTEYFSEQLSTKSQEHEVDFHDVLSHIQRGAKYWLKDRVTVSVNFLCDNFLLLNMYW